MGIALSRTRCDAPDWFPADEFRAYMAQVKRQGLDREREVMQDISRRFNSLPFVRKCRIARKPLMWIFSEVVANVNNRKDRGVWEVDGIVNRYGISVTHRRAGIPVSCYAQARYYLFHSGELAVGVEKVLLQKPDFSGAHIFPRMSLRWSCQREDFLQRFVNVLLSEGRFVSASGDQELALQAKYVRYEDATDVPLIYYPETPYTKGSLVITNRIVKESGAVSTESKIECGVLVNYERVFPLLRTNVMLNVDIPFRGNLLCSAGSTVAGHAMPLYERFHLGGIPYLRGVRFQEFAAQCDNVPMGCDHYATVGVKHVVPFRDERIAAHVFVNGGVAVLTHSKVSTAPLPITTGILTYGWGLTFHILDRVYEANVAGSALRSEGLPFVSIQVGIDTLSSDKS